MGLTFSEQQQLAALLVATSKANDLVDELILARAGNVELAPKMEGASSEEALLRQFLTELGGQLYAERGRGTRVRHLSRGALIRFLESEDESQAKVVAEFRFALDEISRAESGLGLGAVHRLKLAERDRNKADQLFEQFCRSPQRSDDDLVAFGRTQTASFQDRSLALIDLRFLSDIQLAVSTLTTAESAEPARRLARGALSYLAENNDAIRDDLGSFGLTDDIYIMARCAAQLDPKRAMTRDAVDQLLSRWPFLARIHLERASALWRPAEFTLLNAACWAHSEVQKQAIVVPYCDGMALTGGIISALGLLFEHGTSREKFRPKIGEYISPVDRNTPVEVVGYLDEDGRECSIADSQKVRLRQTFRGKRAPLISIHPVEALERYIRSAAPTSSRRFHLQDGSSDVELGPLEGLFGTKVPVARSRLGVRVVVVAPLQEAREALSEYKLNGQPLLSCIPTGRLSASDNKTLEAWSPGTAPDSLLLTFVKTTAQAASLAENWRHEKVFVLVAIKEQEQSESDLSRITGAGARLTIFVPERSFGVQGFLARAGFQFLDWGGAFSKTATKQVRTAEKTIWGNWERLTHGASLRETTLLQVQAPSIEETYDSLRALSRRVQEDYGEEPIESLEKTVNDLHGLFFSLNACAVTTDSFFSEIREKFEATVGETSSLSSYWTEETSTAVAHFTRNIDALIDALSRANPKAEAVATALQTVPGAHIHCSASQYAALQTALSHAPTSPPLGPRHRTRAPQEAALVGFSWLGEARMLKSYFPAPGQPTCLVLYGWESRAFERLSHRRQQLLEQHCSSDQRLSFLPDMEEVSGTPEKPATPDRESREQDELDTWIEHLQRARLIREAMSSQDSTHKVGAILIEFDQGKHCFYAPNHSVTLIADISSDEIPSGQAVTQIAAHELAMGDLLIESAGGNRDVIRELADEALPAGTRALARRWHDALVKHRAKVRSDAELFQELREQGCTRGDQALRGWLHNEHQIGPQVGEDLDFIARATQDTELEDLIPDVFEAIKLVRSAHLSAATALQRKLEVRLKNQSGSREQSLQEVAEAEGLLILGVRRIDRKRRDVCAALVNRVRAT